MTMTSVTEQLRQQEEEIKRIRSKRNNKIDTEHIRKVLNVLFLIIAGIGCVLYFFIPENHLIGLAVLAVGMVIKIVEIFMRIMM